MAGYHPYYLLSEVEEHAHSRRTFALQRPENRCPESYSDDALCGRRDLFEHTHLVSPETPPRSPPVTFFAHALPSPIDRNVITPDHTTDVQSFAARPSGRIVARGEEIRMLEDELLLIKENTELYNQLVQDIQLLGLGHAQLPTPTDEVEEFTGPSLKTPSPFFLQNQHSRQTDERAITTREGEREATTLPEYKKRLARSSGVQNAPVLPKAVLSEEYEGRRRLELWQFLLRQLLLGKHKNVLSWVSQQNGQFRIHDPSGLAKLWGNYRCTSASLMTYGKVARVLRYYYNRSILKRSSVRLVYVFTEHIMAQVRK